MNSWKSTLIPADASIIDAINIIDRSAMQIGLVVDDQRKLLGVVTDGDIRRAILNKVSLDEPVKTIMAKEPISAHVNDVRELLLRTMKQKNLRHLPILDDDGCVVGLETFFGLVKQESFDNPVVIMAGGKGTRLRPLTEDCPKPLLCVGDKPILETILENFLSFGFRRFYFSVNYKAEMIQDHFGNGEKWGADISYIEEKQPLGTAGALSLLPERPTMPFFVMNGDLLTKVNFRHLLDFHTDHGANATMCVRQYQFQVPYGVVQTDGQKLLEVEEKPVHSFFVNAGIYVLNPAVLDVIPANTYYDMPELFEHLLKQGRKPTVFPIREYWLDIGQIGDYEQANKDMKQEFS
jgi:dTDP-glucose pyrophosphorylase